MDNIENLSIFKTRAINYNVLPKDELEDHHTRLMKALNKIRDHECTERMKGAKMKLSSEVNKYVPGK